MYKVFINDRSLILTDNYADYTSDYDTLFLHFSSETAFFESVELLRDSPVLKSVCVFNEDLESLWNLFCTKYTMVEAAGGVVQNGDKILFIYKNGHWDLPKGKMESRESSETTALREVKEECGINDLNIDRAMDPTYYLFTENGQMKLKKTHWYLMNSSDDGPFKGDENEGITEVKWMDSKAWKEDMKKSYSSVLSMMSSML